MDYINDNQYAAFYNWLMDLDGSNGFVGFALVCIGVCFSCYFFCWLLPVTLMHFFTLLLVLFVPSFNDVKRDKFLWDKNTYIYRKVDNLYDEYGYCIKSPWYNWVYKHKKIK